MAEQPDRSAPARSDRDEPERISADLTPKGRYIPYGGGSAGWFENSGVLKSERRNNYGFEQEMDLPEVRSKQFLRWGPAYDRRDGVPRKRRQLPMNLLREGRASPMTTWDVNHRGIRLQFSEAPAMDIGDEFGVELLDGEGAVLTLLNATVVWVQQAGATRQVWSVGLFFPQIAPEAGATLNLLLED